MFEGKELSLSESMIETMKTKDLSYFELISSLSEKNKKFFTDKELNLEKEKEFIDQSEKSKLEHLKIEEEQDPLDVNKKLSRKIKFGISP